MFNTTFQKKQDEPDRESTSASKLISWGKVEVISESNGAISTFFVLYYRCSTSIGLQFDRLRQTFIYPNPNRCSAELFCEGTSIVV